MSKMTNKQLLEENAALRASLEEARRHYRIMHSQIAELTGKLTAAVNDQTFTNKRGEHYTLKGNVKTFVTQPPIH